MKLDIEIQFNNSFYISLLLLIEWNSTCLHKLLLKIYQSRRFLDEIREEDILFGLNKV